MHEPADQLAWRLRLARLIGAAGATPDTSAKRTLLDFLRDGRTKPSHRRPESRPAVESGHRSRSCRDWWTRRTGSSASRRIVGADVATGLAGCLVIPTALPTGESRENVVRHSAEHSVGGVTTKEAVVENSQR